jgi:hypothetical protein
MDVVWMDNKRFSNILLEEGQSTVEYIMLFVVVMGLGLLVFKSASFQNLMGPNSSVFQVMAKKMEYSYRNGHNETIDNFAEGGSNYTAPQHEVYWNKNDGKSRFFGPTSSYE